MSVKFNIKEPPPLFKRAVEIPLPGGAKSPPVTFEFKHKRREVLTEWLKGMDGRPKTDLFLEFVAGWALEDAFGRESVDDLLSNYMGTFDKVLSDYIDELTQRNLGN